jgi:hypothetical protein
MKADYELRHKLYGQQGSLWERQVDDVTRGRIRAIVSEAGHASTLATLDRVAAGAVNEGQVLVEDTFFRFVDGDFAVVGRRQRDYNHRSVVLSDGSRVYVGYRAGAGSYSADPIPTILANVSDAFLSYIDGTRMGINGDATRDWYLVPTPSTLRPIVIQGKNFGEYLIQGVDFLAFDGYIALTDSPTEVLPLGLVKVNSAYRKVSSPNNFVLSAPAQRTGHKWMAEYAYKTQSVEACRRAAAEYAGLYVFDEADVALSVYDMGGVARTYNMAVAGVLEITYPHTPLTLRQTVEAGFVLCRRFDLVSARHLAEDNALRNAASGWDYPFALDGVLPVNGLTWDGGTVTIEAGATDPGTGKVHARMMFEGEQETLEALWRLTAAQELATGEFLVDTPLLSGGFPGVVDGWDLFQTFYGSQLLLALASSHDPTINSRLWRFLSEHHPKSCNLLLSIDLAAETVPVTGGSGEPLVDEVGEYVAAPLIEPCEEFLLAVLGNPLYVVGNPLTYTLCS